MLVGLIDIIYLVLALAVACAGAFGIGATKAWKKGRFINDALVKRDELSKAVEPVENKPVVPLRDDGYSIG